MLLVFSIIFIAMVLTCSLDIIFAAPAMNVAPWFFIVAVVVSVVYQFAVDGLFAFIVSKCPNKWFENKKFFDVSKKEQRFYEKLGIRSWKDKVWELGGLGGFSKAKIDDPKNPEYIKRFLIESYKGEVDHIIGMIAGFSVIFIFPLRFALIVGLPIAVVNAFINYLSVMILRYNTPKLLVLHKRAVRNLELAQKQENEKVKQEKNNEPEQNQDDKNESDAKADENNESDTKADENNETKEDAKK